jgi:hypothetical protein
MPIHLSQYSFALETCPDINLAFFCDLYFLGTTVRAQFYYAFRL